MPSWFYYVTATLLARYIFCNNDCRGSAEELRHGTTPFPEIPSVATHPSAPPQGAGGARPKQPKQLPGVYLPPSSSSKASVKTVPGPPLPSGIGSVEVDP